MTDSVIDEETLRFMSLQMRGIHQAIVRFVGDEAPQYESALVDLLLGLGVSATITRMTELAPPPRRRIGIQFKGRNAVLTVDPRLPLNG